MKFYSVKEGYVAFLKTIDSRVPDSYNGKKPFIGVVFSIGHHKYLAPLSSYKSKQDRMDSSAPSLLKIHERGNPENKLGIIQLNNMIPVLDSEIELFDLEAQEEKYKAMMYKQFEFIKTKEDEIRAKAEKLYHLVVNDKHTFFSAISCDFLKLEGSYRTFK
jgi:protein AbiQ